MALHADGGNAPYASPKTMIDVISKYRDRGLQTPFTTGILSRAGVSDGLVARTLQAFKILDLVDEEGSPTETLETLKLATTEDFPKRLAELIREAYEPIFAFANPTTDEPQLVRDAFRAYKPQGQRARMVALFYGLCEAAKIIEVNPLRTRDTSKTAKTPKGRKPKQHNIRVKKDDQQGLSHLTNHVPGPIAALMNELPKNGSWTVDEKNRFTDTFEALLNFSFKIVKNSQNHDDLKGGGE